MNLKSETQMLLYSVCLHAFKGKPTYSCPLEEFGFLIYISAAAGRQFLGQTDAESTNFKRGKMRMRMLIAMHPPVWNNYDYLFQQAEQLYSSDTFVPSWKSTHYVVGLQRGTNEQLLSRDRRNNSVEVKDINVVWSREVSMLTS